MTNGRLLILLCIFSLTLAGCASTIGSMSDSGNEIRIREDDKPSPNTRAEKYAITVRLAGFNDLRQVDSPRRLGVMNSRVLGLTGKDILSDRDIAQVVADSMKKRLTETGLQIVASDVPNAQFQLSGIVKELSIDVKDRDYVKIAIESTLTEVSSGKVIWSGLVVEKADRYAGVSGNGKKDIADYLRAKLGVVSVKTSESILSVLMATRPDLFNMAVGIKPVLGVTVFSNSSAGTAIPILPAAGQAESVPANGTLVVNAKPSRAKVYVDGVYFGLTPLHAEIGVGVHEVTVKLDGYQVATEKVSIRKGDSTELELKLQR